MIESVSIADAEIALSDVFAAVTIRHGRVAVDDPPLGSTCTLTLENVTREWANGFRVATSLAIDTTGAVPRFRGRITDASLDPAAATLALTAVSTLARISGRTVGAVDWPSETWSARVARVFAEADAADVLVLQVGDHDPVLTARAANPQTLADALSKLSVTEAAAIADLPDGTVLVQAVTSRKGVAPITLDSGLVELAPVWDQSDDVRNVVAVDWGTSDDGGTVTVTDAASIAAYEEREPLTLTTDIATETAASLRAQTELVRRARPDWVIDAATLLVLDTSIGVGAPVHLTDLPAAAPSPETIGMVEGWQDDFDGDTWTMQLALSPIRLSGYGATWGGVDPAITWANVDPTATWAENEVLLFG